MDIYDLAAEETKKAPDKTSDASTKDNDTPVDKWSVSMIQISAYDSNKKPDPDCPMPERILWWTLRDVYMRYRNDRITKEQGEAEKTAALQKYRTDKSVLDGYRTLVQANAEKWRDIEQKAIAYAKSSNRSVEADAFFKAVYGTTPLQPIAGDGQQ